MVKMFTKTETTEVVNESDYDFVLMENFTLNAKRLAALERHGGQHLIQSTRRDTDRLYSAATTDTEGALISFTTSDCLDHSKIVFRNSSSDSRTVELRKVERSGTNSWTEVLNKTARTFRISKVAAAADPAPAPVGQLKGNGRFLILSDDAALGFSNHRVEGEPVVGGPNCVVDITAEDCVNYIKIIIENVDTLGQLQMRKIARRRSSGFSLGHDLCRVL